MKINKLKHIILAIGVLASVAFYVKEYVLSSEGNEIVSFMADSEDSGDMSKEASGNADLQEGNDSGNASEDSSLHDGDNDNGLDDKNLSEENGGESIDPGNVVRLSDEDKSYIEEIVRSTLRDELMKICSEEGYLEMAVSKGQEAAAAAALENAGKVNINTAGVSELTTLEGIGEKRAGDIISYREKNGSFNSIEELMNIKGIKQAAFEKIKDKIYV